MRSCAKNAHFLLLVFKALTGIKRSALLFEPFASISAAFVILPTRVEAALLSSPTPPFAQILIHRWMGRPFAVRSCGGGTRRGIDAWCDLLIGDIEFLQLWKPILPEKNKRTCDFVNSKKVIFWRKSSCGLLTVWPYYFCYTPPTESNGCKLTDIISTEPIFRKLLKSPIWKKSLQKFYGLEASQPGPL